MKYLGRLLPYVLCAAAVLVFSGCNSKSKKKNFDVMVARFLLEADEGEGYPTVSLPISESKISVNTKPVITEYDFTAVQLAQSDMGKFLVFYLTQEAGRDLYRVTGNNQGKRLVLFINDRPMGARRIERPINTGAITVFAELSEDLLPELVKNLDGTSKDLQEKIEKAKK